MRINNNMLAMNTHRQMGITGVNQGKSMEKLSSGLRINRAGDDAAGLAISEKMRGQIRGLNMASKNSQDGISMIQTAEGALNETHAILQRMRELATQSANDTNVGVDRGEIQKEINQLSSEINRIGNTTEFNTQALLKGDGGTSLNSSGVVANATLTAGTDVVHTDAVATVANSGLVAGDTAKTLKATLNGIDLTLTYTHSAGATAGSATAAITGPNAATLTHNVSNAADTATAQAEAFQAMIDANDVLAGNYTAKVSVAGTLEIKAVSGGKYEGAAGNIDFTESAALATATTITETGAIGATAAATAPEYALDLTGYTTTASVDALIGTGFTLDGTTYEFYNANDGDYTGEAVGINVSDVYATGVTVENTLGDVVASQLNLADGISATSDAAGKVTITSNSTGKDVSLEFVDGGIQENFKANFQVGANEGQSMTIEISDMRSEALGITGDAGADGFTSSNSVTDGTSNKSVEAALDVSSHEKASAAITVINDAIEKVSAQRSDLGSYQNRLEHTIKNLDTSAENLQASEARIRDVDMAKEMMNLTKQNILQQASQAMMAQANQAPQGVLQLLR